MKQKKDKRFFKQKKEHVLEKRSLLGFLPLYPYWSVSGCSYFRTIKTTQEKKMWDAYVDEFNENGLTVRRRKRSKSSLPESWDDINLSQNKSFSWKLRTKCKKQWEKNIK